MICVNISSLYNVFWRKTLLFKYIPLIYHNFYGLQMKICIFKSRVSCGKSGYHFWWVSIEGTSEDNISISPSKYQLTLFKIMPDRSHHLGKGQKLSGLDHTGQAVEHPRLSIAGVAYYRTRHPVIWCLRTDPFCFCVVGTLGLASLPKDDNTCLAELL